MSQDINTGSNGSYPSQLTVLNNELLFRAYENIRLFPNPSNQSFQIANLKTKANLKVYDLNGKALMSISNYNGENLNISHLSQGFYLIKINLDEYQNTLKLLKE
jgi:hypothetical protein